ncbi:RE2, partial [Symbiodinium sp. KB8]
MFHVYDTQETRFDMMSAIDVASSFQVVGALDGHSAGAMEATFNRLWSNVFGPPGTLSLDLENGLQAGLSRYSEWFGCRIKNSAGQAHWQNGVIERHGAHWKAIFARVNDECSLAGKGDIELAAVSINSAKNNLVKRCGYSPAQIVFGKGISLPEDIAYGRNEEQMVELLTFDRQRQREAAIRGAARTAFFRTNTDDKFRRALLQRARVAPGEAQVGEMVCFLRKEKNRKDPHWRGPGVAIGHEGQNTWVSFAGRCHLCAPEHLRRASAEEVGGLFSLEATRKDLERLVQADFDDPELFQRADEEKEDEPGDGLPHEEDGDDDLGDVVPDLTADVETYNIPGGEVDMEEDVLPEQNRGERRAGNFQVPAAVTKRIRKKGPEHQAGATDCVNKTPHTSYMLKKASTARGREKQLEKEIPWSATPQEQHAAFRAAEDKQWKEHLEHDALEPLSIEESDRVRQQEDASRILNSRFAYKDKHWAKRKKDPSIPWKAKSRLVVGGHLDPDIGSIAANTDAPTVSRLGILLLLQFVASNLSRGWTAAAGDVSAAFLNGPYLERILYLKQPQHGIGGLHPRQLIKVKKGIFGLCDSPRGWWKKLLSEILELKIDVDDGEFGSFQQNPLDPCIFQLCPSTANGRGAPMCYVAVHVDDLLVVGPERLASKVREALSRIFPVDSWELDTFEYVGSTIEVNADSTRLFTVEIDAKEDDDAMASREQAADNQSLVGALGWLANQSRPDLVAGVSMSQQVQKEPTIGDVRFTNQLARRAFEHKEQGVVLHDIDLVDLQKSMLLAYHDAGWANAPQSVEDPFYQLTEAENQAGLVCQGPHSYKGKKLLKKTNSKLASQYGMITFLADNRV